MIFLRQLGGECDHICLYSTVGKIIILCHILSHEEHVTHLMKSPMGSVVWFSIVSIAFISKNIISLTLIRASSLVRT